MDKSTMENLLRDLKAATISDMPHTAAEYWADTLEVYNKYYSKPLPEYMVLRALYKVHEKHMHCKTTSATLYDIVQELRDVLDE